MVFEYHHMQAKDSRSELGPFLSQLEEYGFDYSFSVTNFGLFRKSHPQNLFIFAYKRD